MFTITEVYNNTARDPALTPAWGFACYIREAGLLFDTGGDGSILLHNLHHLGIDPQSIKRIVISHDHWDHTGGLEVLVDRTTSATLFIPSGFTPETSRLSRKFPEVQVITHPGEIADGIMTTGPLGDTIIEQSLVLQARRGLFVITGCAHPHIGTILDRVRTYGQVMGVMGGFHDVTDADVAALERLDYVSASHCTKRLDTVIERCGATYIPGGAGRIHRV